MAHLGFLAPALIALIAGLLIHSFIIGVSVTDWWKGRPVTPVDQIVTSLAVSRIGAQSVSTFYIYLVAPFLKHLDSPVTRVIINGIFDFLAYANVWLTALLSIVLYMKISSSHSRPFLYLRGVMLHRTVGFIVAAVLLSAFSCIIQSSEATTEETTMGNSSMHCSSANDVNHYIIGTSFPFTFYCISSALLFTSLYHHTVKMKMSSNVSINLEPYYSVMKYIAFTFIYNTGYLISDVVSVFYSKVYCEHLDWFPIVLDFSPILHSSYLIYRTAKLKSQMTKVLQNVIDVLFQRKYTESEEHIEVVAL